MKKILFVLLLIVIFIPFQHSNASTSLYYTYTISKDNSSNNYIFSITFTNNMTVYRVNMTYNNNSYLLREGLQKNNFYTYLPSSIQNAKVELHMATSEGPITAVFIINHKNSINFDVNTIIASILFILLLILLSKYVLFYDAKH